MLPVTASPFSSPAPTKTDSFNRTTGLFTDPEDYHHSIGSFYSLNETRQCRTQNHVRPHSLCRMDSEDQLDSLKDKIYLDHDDNVNIIYSNNANCML